MLKICVIGAGRMGQEILSAAAGDIDLSVSGVVDKPESPFIGTIMHGSTVTDNLESASQDADIIVDFSGASGTSANLPKYAALKKPLVIGSTGFSEKERGEITALAATIPILMDSNMSVGVNVLAKLVEQAAASLGADFDAEIFEVHHKYKKDAPSGTALMLGEAVATGQRKVSALRSGGFSNTGFPLVTADESGRSGEFNTGSRAGERRKGEIGFSVVRGGDIAGEHTVFFCGMGERIELIHRAQARSIFAKGALRAAKWLKDKNAGLYRIKDMLAL